jgi:hypothetical protein
MGEFGFSRRHIEEIAGDKVGLFRHFRIWHTAANRDDIPIFQLRHVIDEIAPDDA